MRLPARRLPELPGPALVYAALAVALWPSPLLGLLHVESSAAVAGVAFFAAGLAALRAFRERRPFAPVLRMQLALLAVPWALLTLSLLWRANCGYGQGLGLFALFTLPSVALAVALAWALAGAGLRRPGVWFVGIGLAVATLPVLYDLGLHPQFYTYNHVWGGVLGPIYDEWLAVRPGLFFFRGLTLLWAALLVMLGTWLRTRGTVAGRRVARLGAGVAVGIGLAYLFAPRLGFVTTEEVLERRLSARWDDGRVVLHFAPEAAYPFELQAMGDEVAYRYGRLRDALGVEPEEKIHVYVYPDPETRAALTGARWTSVAPTWLRRPQVHLLAEHATPDVIGHELAHAFAREFGAPLIHASWAVGLVEGLAVAVEPPDGLPLPAAQVAAGWRLEPAAAGALAQGPARAVAGAMDPLGFWTGRGAVSYTTTGAFTRWLLDRYGAAPLREAYRTADFYRAYGQTVERLATAWERELRRAPVTAEALALARWRFAQPSLFERRCPHHVPREVRLTREAERALEPTARAGVVDEARARRLFEEALRASPTYGPALVGWAERALTDGDAPRPVAARLRAVVLADTLGDVALRRTLADALRLADDEQAARAAYADARAVLPPYAHEARAWLLLRPELPPAALSLLLDVRDPFGSARRLERLATGVPAARPFAAALLARVGEGDAAYAMVNVEPPAESLLLARADAEVVVRQWEAWRAAYAFAAGNYAAVEAAAERAAARFAAAGLDGPAAALRDLAAKARWRAGTGRAVRGYEVAPAGPATTTGVASRPLSRR